MFSAFSGETVLITGQKGQKAAKNKIFPKNPCQKEQIGI
jgi:hypothetical protein